MRKNKTIKVYWLFYVLLLTFCLISASKIRNSDSGNKKAPVNKKQENLQLLQLFVSAVNVESEQKKHKKQELDRKRKEKILKEQEMRNSIYRTYLVDKHPSYSFLRDFFPNRPM